MANEHMKRCLAIVSHEESVASPHHEDGCWRTIQLKKTSVREDVTKTVIYTLLVQMENGVAAAPGYSSKG